MRCIYITVIIIAAFLLTKGDNLSVPPECEDPIKVDVIFAVDNSLGVSPKHIDKFKEFIKNFINLVAQFPGSDVHYGVVPFRQIYGKDYDIPLEEYPDLPSLLERVKAIKKELVFSSKLLSQTLGIIEKEVLPSCRSDAKAIIIILTDGVYNKVSDIETELKSIWKRGVATFGITTASNDLSAIKLLGGDNHFIKSFRQFATPLDVAFSTLADICSNFAVRGHCDKNPNPVDIVFAVDSNVNDVEWSELKMLLKGIVMDALSEMMGETGNRVAMIRYRKAGEVAMVMNFGDFRTKTDVISKMNQTQKTTNPEFSKDFLIRHAPRKWKETYGGIADALHYVRMDIFSPSARNDARKVLVLMTGNPANNLPALDIEAKLMKKAGIHVVSIGFGRAKLPEVLTASANRFESIFFKRSFVDELLKDIDLISKNICVKS